MMMLNVTQKFKYPQFQKCDTCLNKMIAGINIKYMEYDWSNSLFTLNMDIFVDAIISILEILSNGYQETLFSPNGYSLQGFGMQSFIFTQYTLCPQYPYSYEFIKKHFFLFQCDAGYSRWLIFYIMYISGMQANIHHKCKFQNIFSGVCKFLLQPFQSLSHFVWKNSTHNLFADMHVQTTLY